MPTDQRVRLKDFQRVQYSGSQTIEPGKNKAIMLLKATRFGDLRRSTLSWCRRTRISACKAARDRNNPITAHQINLQRSPIAIDYCRFAGNRQPYWVCGRHRLDRDRNRVRATRGRLPRLGKHRQCGGADRARRRSQLPPGTRVIIDQAQPMSAPTSFVYARVA